MMYYVREFLMSDLAPVLLIMLIALLCLISSDRAERREYDKNKDESGTPQK